MKELQLFLENSQSGIPILQQLKTAAAATYGQYLQTYLSLFLKCGVQEEQDTGVAAANKECQQVLAGMLLRHVQFLQDNKLEFVRPAQV